MNTLKLNSAGLNRVTLNTIGEVRFKSRGGEPKPPSYENGVYIQHIDGKLYTTDEWTAKAFANDEANGVAVKADKCSFVMAMKVYYNYMWSSSNKSKVSGVLLTNDEAVAKTDLVGMANTELVSATDTSQSAYLCSNYIFPNGQKGYLPSIGEWWVAAENSTDVLAAFSALGLNYFTGNYPIYWSSTQYSASMAWKINWFQQPKILGEGKSNSINLRCLPFTELK